MQRLLQFALDGGVDENVTLRAIRDALDRAGLMAKTEVAVEVKAPWEELLGDVAHITKAQHEAMKRGEPLPPTPPAALPPPVEDIVDAEVVPDDPVPQPERDGERAEGARVPDWAEPPPASRTGALVPLEDATAEAAQANRAARVVRVRRRRG